MERVLSGMSSIRESRYGWAHGMGDREAVALLQMLNGLEENVFTVEKKLAFDTHISLISSLNRENPVYQIKKSYDW